MLFYSKLNSENKTHDKKKFSQSCHIDYQINFLHKRNDVFCSLKIYQAIKKIGYQAFNEQSADNLIVAYIFKI